MWRQGVINLLSEKLTEDLRTLCTDDVRLILYVRMVIEDAMSRTMCSATLTN